MKELLALHLRRNLDYVETEGMPAWTEERFYALDYLPGERFTSGSDALVWAQRGNQRFIYIGVLRNVRRADAGLQFDRFDKLSRPVVLVDADIDNTKKFYDGTKGFMNDFSYVAEEAFAAAVEHSMRQAKD